jgi:chromosome segregation ATPase
MGNETSKGLSVNVKTFILVLVFVNVGFASKMIHKYYAMKEAGYIREQTFKEQLEQRVMKSFGSIEEMNQMVADITRQKEEAEKLADSFKEQGEQLRFTNVKIEDSKSKLEEEKARLQKQIWELEDSLLQGKNALNSKETLIQELTSKIEVLEKENAELKERLK